MFCGRRCLCWSLWSCLKGLCWCSFPIVCVVTYSPTKETLLIYKLQEHSITCQCTLIAITSILKKKRRTNRNLTKDYGSKKYMDSPITLRHINLLFHTECGIWGWLTGSPPFSRNSAHLICLHSPPEKSTPILIVQPMMTEYANQLTSPSQTRCFARHCPVNLQDTTSAPPRASLTHLQANIPLR